MTTIIFEKRKAWAIDEDGDIDVEIFQNESGKIGVRLTSIYSSDTTLDGLWFFDDLAQAHKKFLTLNGRV